VTVLSKRKFDSALLPPTSDIRIETEETQQRLPRLSLMQEK